MNHTEADFVITHPEGYDLNPAIVGNHTVNYNQEEALAGADVVYVKNWCSYTDYGAILRTDNKWMMTREKMERTNDAFLCIVFPSEETWLHQTAFWITQSHWSSNKPITELLLHRPFYKKF